MTWPEENFNKIVLVIGPILIGVFAWRLTMGIGQLEAVCLTANLVLWVPIVIAIAIEKIRGKAKEGK